MTAPCESDHGVEEDERDFSATPHRGELVVTGGKIEKPVPRASDEGHGARIGESDVVRCGQAACVVTAVYSVFAIGECPRTEQLRNHPECGGKGVCISGTGVA